MDLFRDRSDTPATFPNTLAAVVNAEESTRMSRPTARTIHDTTPTPGCHRHDIRSHAARHVPGVWAIDP